MMNAGRGFESPKSCRGVEWNKTQWPTLVLNRAVIPNSGTWPGGLLPLCAKCGRKFQRWLFIFLFPWAPLCLGTPPQLSILHPQYDGPGSLTCPPTLRVWTHHGLLTGYFLFFLMLMQSNSAWGRESDNTGVSIRLERRDRNQYPHLCHTHAHKHKTDRRGSSRLLEAFQRGLAGSDEVMWSVIVVVVTFHLREEGRSKTIQRALKLLRK